MKIIGHRGARGLDPENTIAGFKRALHLQVDAIECDVRLTSDNIPVVCHDSYITSPQGDTYAVVEHTLSELRMVYPELATLEGTIRYLDKRLPLHIEIKPGVATQPIINLIQMFFDTGWDYEDLLFASFDQRILLAIRHSFPKGQCIVLENWSSLHAVHRARVLHTSQICMNQRWLWRPFIRRMTKSGYELSSYTVNSIEQAKRFESAGLVAIVTDYPDRFTH